MQHTIDLSACSDVHSRTQTIQQAIDSVAQSGGGTVTVPAGEWRVTTVHLRSGVTLELAFNAVLKAHPNLDDYPATTTQDANKDRQPYHLLVAEDCEDVALIGDGCVDGDGPSFWYPSMRSLAQQGVDVEAYCDEHNLPPVYRKANHPWWREHERRISPMLEFKRVKRLRLRGVTIANSPGWTVHAHDCDDLHIQGITIANNLYGPNTDGLDLNGCRDVRISDCDLTCGDDAIILKAMADSRSCERVAVSNCIISTNCAALGLGAETVFPIRDIAFTGCIVRQALRAFQIEMWEAGLIENVVVSNITGTTATEIPLQRALYIDIQHHGRTDGALGTCRNIQFSNIALTTRGRCLFTAADGAVIEDVVLRDVHLSYPTIENAAETVPTYNSSQMSNDAPEARAINAMVVASNCDRLQLHNVFATWPGEGTNTAGDPDANSDLNPHHNDPAMHGAWLRNCQRTLIDSPFLAPFRTEDGAERIVAIDSSIHDRGTFAAS